MFNILVGIIVLFLKELLNVYIRVRMRSFVVIHFSKYMYNVQVHLFLNNYYNDRKTYYNIIVIINIIKKCLLFLNRYSLKMQ